MNTICHTDLDQREQTALASDPDLAELVQECPELGELLEKSRHRYYRQIREGALGDLLYGMGVLDRPFYQFLKKHLWPKDPNLAATPAYWLHIVDTAFRVQDRGGMDTLVAYKQWLDQVFRNKRPAVYAQAWLFKLANNCWFKKSEHQKLRKLYAEFLVSAISDERFSCPENRLTWHFFTNISIRTILWRMRGKAAINPLTLRNAAYAAVQFAAYVFPVLLRRFDPDTAFAIVARQGLPLFEQWLYNQSRRFALHLQEAGCFDERRYQPLPTQPLFNWLPAIVLSNFEQVPYPVCRHLCAGKPLRTAPGLRFPLNAKAAHRFSLLPAGTNWQDAFLFARVAAAGGSIALVQELNADAGHLEGWDDDRFLTHAIEFLTRHESKIWRQQVRPLLDYLWHCRTQNPQFALKGRSPEALLRRMEEWHRDLATHRQLAHLPKTWKPAPGKGLLYTAKNGARYRIVQLCTAEALWAEGRAMSHCVAGYAGRCAQGYSSIWSLRREEETPDAFERMITIELDSQRRIVQVRGAHNRLPNEEEMRLIRIWEQKGLGKGK